MSTLGHLVILIIGFTAGFLFRALEGTRRGECAGDVSACDGDRGVGGGVVNPKPLIPLAYADNSAIEIVPPRDQDAISQAFAQARETIAEIETARDCWSPAQARSYR